MKVQTGFGRVRWKKMAQWALVLVFSVFFAGYVTAFWVTTSAFKLPEDVLAAGVMDGYLDSLTSVDLSAVLAGMTLPQWLVFTALLAVSTVVGVSMVEGCTRWLSFLCRWRYVAALVVLFFAVTLQLNSTSLDCWSWFAISPDAVHPIFGTARYIRSDEFAVWTPLTIAQELASYPAVNPLYGGGTDSLWISVGGVPAWNSAVLLKPLYWGFLLFGTARGLSFLYTLRYLLLFLVSFELAFKYTRGSRPMSLLAALLLTFAPYVQWLLSQSIAEVLIFGQGMLLCLWNYLETRSRRRRVLLGIGMAWCFGCYVMVGYPAWLISVLYVLLGFTIALLVMHRCALTFRRDAVKLGLPMLAVLTLLGIIVWQGWDALSRVMNSQYPGARFETGGLMWYNMYAGTSTVFMPLVCSVDNPCEYANFITLMPLGLILAADVLVLQRKRDPLLIAMAMVETFLLAFELIGFPDWLAKLTFIYQCPPSRCITAMGLADTVLLIRALSLSKTRRPAACVVVSAAVAMLSGYLVWRIYSDQLWLVAASATLTLILAFLLTLSSGRRKQVAAFCMGGVMLLAGGLVNPIQQGISPITQLEIVDSIKSVQAPVDTIWLTESPYPMNLAPLLAGYQLVNGVQEYADTAQWTVLDPDGQYQDVYNRFAHVGVTLSDTTTSFELVNAAYFMIHLKKSDLRTLHVDYLVTPREYLTDQDGVHFELITWGGGFRVYKLSYLDEES